MKDAEWDAYKKDSLEQSEKIKEVINDFDVN